MFYILLEIHRIRRGGIKFPPRLTNKKNEANFNKVLIENDKGDASK